MQQLVEKPPAERTTDFLPLNGTDFVEFYVGNAKQAAYYYRAAFGMNLVAYRGPETGTRDRASYVLQQDKIRFVFTTPLQPDSPISDHIRLHGDGVHQIALWVDDAASAYHETVRRGARGIQEPATFEDEHGEVEAIQHRRIWRHHPWLRRAQGLSRRFSARLPCHRRCGFDRTPGRA